jgi:hypothetical protein
MIAQHRQAAGGFGLGRLVLQDVPMLGELAVLKRTTSVAIQAPGRPMPENHVF